MARYTGPSCRLCRREGKKLYLKGDRCLGEKCAVSRRPNPPGQHGASRIRIKEYGIQLREKQTAKRYYGLQERQFKNYYIKAEKKPGITGENLLSMLETRLDNVVYRMSMASSRKEARQLVLHGHFRLNGKKVNIPSILVKPGDVISLKEGKRNSVKIKELIERCQTALVPKWLDVDRNNIVARVLAVPARDDVDFDINEQLIVELYSK
ncbi:MAG: 30S ribosomal protein S4 [Eubacteriales bacterium]|jgi:small subunit ribosomal protein S4|nr:30S ribosomal protein S4 [Clostridiales bacterium]